MHVIYGRAMALDLEKNDNYDKNNQFTAVRWYYPSFKNLQMFSL